MNGVRPLSPRSLVSRWRAGQAGFSLMEVLVALAILLLAAVVLGSAYVNVLNSYAAASRSHDADEDAAFALQQLLAEPDVDKAKDGNQFDSLEGRRVTWTSTIEPTTTADLFTVTFQCEVSASGQIDARKSSQTFTILRPTWSDPAERTKLFQEAKDRIVEMQSKTSNGYAPPAAVNGGAVGGGGGGGRASKGGGGANGGGGRGTQNGRGGQGGGQRNDNGGGGIRSPLRNDGSPQPKADNTTGNPSRRNNR